MAHQRPHRILLPVAVATPARALGRRKLQYALRPVPRRAERVEEEGDVLGGLVHLAMARGDDEDRALGCAREAGDHEGARGAPEAAGLYTQISLGEGVGEVLERPPATEYGGWNGHVLRATLQRIHQTR